MQLPNCIDDLTMKPICIQDVTIDMLKVKSKTYNVAKGKHGYGYKRIYCGFDIETTNVINRAENTKLAFMWIWQFAFEQYIIIGRTWEQFTDLLCKIILANQLNKRKRLLLPIANLSYEFQFFRKHFYNIQVFAKQERQPLQALLYDCIDCRDVLAISGGNLASLAKDYTKTQKRIGDLDYKKQRNKSYIPTTEEFQYIYNDVVILKEYSEFLFDNFIISKHYLPITKTAICRYKMKKGMTADDKEIIKEGFPSWRDYKIITEKVLRGGYVHGSASNIGITLYLQKMLDYTSSYPATMFHNKNFPYGAPVRICNIDKATFSEMIETDTRFYFKVRFRRLQATIGHSIESKNKCELTGKATIDNGRIYYADYCETWLNDIDFRIYKMFYKWSKMEILEFYYFPKKGALPAYVLDPLKEDYMLKAQLKKAGKPYAIVKTTVNSYFGATLTKIYESDITYNAGEWGTDASKFDFNKVRKNQFLLPQWGLYVTSFAKFNLLQAVYEIDKNRAIPNVVFCDTDSLKVKVYDEITRRVIENWNKKMMELNKDLPPEFYDLGMFDDETKNIPFVRFKTLGAKRYIYEDFSGVHVTIAGLPKKALPDFCEKNNINIFDFFNENNMYLDLEESDRLTTCYHDEETSAIVDGEEMKELSSVALYEIPFRLNVSGDFIAFFLNERQKEGRK